MDSEIIYNNLKIRYKSDTLYDIIQSNEKHDIHIMIMTLIEYKDYEILDKVISNISSNNMHISSYSNKYENCIIKESIVHVSDDALVVNIINTIYENLDTILLSAIILSIENKRDISIISSLINKIEDKTYNIIRIFDLLIIITTKFDDINDIIELIRNMNIKVSNKICKYKNNISKLIKRIEFDICNKYQIIALQCYTKYMNKTYISLNKHYNCIDYNQIIYIKHHKTIIEIRKEKKEIDDNICCICIEELNNNIIVLTCGHTMHNMCLGLCIKKNITICPICKYEFTYNIESIL